MARTPSQDDPLTGRCLCGGVRFSVTQPFVTAGYCHCTHCQRRTGTAASPTAMLPGEGVRIDDGEDLLRAFQPEGGRPKLFCSRCGSSLFAGDPRSADEVGVRLGALDEQPPVRLEYHQYLDSAVAWEPVPDDGLQRFPGPRDAA